MLYDRSNYKNLLRVAPKRIVSLVPSLTEYLYSLGLDKRVVGLTKFCVHPKGWKKDKTIVGGTKNLRMDTIRALKPDLIIANKEENEKNQVMEMAEEFPVYVSVIRNFEEALEELESIAHCCDRREKGKAIVSDILKKKKSYPSPSNDVKAIYLIWKNPWMAAGGDTFIHHMMEKAGFHNMLKDQLRYPTMELEQMKALEPAYILLSSEPFPFKKNHCEELEKEFPASRVLLVDGELFSWYGSRLLKSFDYFEELRRDILR
ncbi:MAG TPA: helical backbone metal receptor [Saprospiraceae bacterium]|nr:helical backbone metal receptor [Saprospiraceae bacterium]